MKFSERVLSTAAALTLMCSLVSTAPAQAATAARMTLTPAVKTVTKGTVVTLVVKVNTGSCAVNTVQFYITLPPNLRCGAITLIADAWTDQAANTCQGQTAAFASSSRTPFTGIARVARVKVRTPAVGQSTVAFDRSRTFVVDASTNSDVLGSTTTSVVTVNP